MNLKDRVELLVLRRQLRREEKILCRLEPTQWSDWERAVNRDLIGSTMGRCEELRNRINQLESRQ